MEIRAGEAGRTAGFKCGEGGFGDGSGLSERSLPWEMTPLVPSQPPALIFIPVSPKHPPCGSGGEHLLHMSSMQCQALALQLRLSVLAGLKQSPWLFCLRASLPGVAPWQCLVHFAEGAMPGAHPQSHHGHAAVAWNHRGHKTYQEVSVWCLRVPEKWKHQAFYAPWDLQPGRVPYELCRAAPKSGSSSLHIAGCMVTGEGCSAP